ncbi:type I restriction enzyme S subunit [Bacillus fengqiuensis]|nr:type I restriction enzyme S subunit [Bacillus fengqiuensis]
MKSSYKRLGDYIREVNIRNANLKDVKLLGVSIQKEFIPSIANTIGTNMSTYKLIKKNQFAYGPVTSRNGDKISVALLGDYEEAIISQAYTSFEIIDEDELLPEYLMMWFRRPEFDRYARFMSHGSAREIFGWEEMCNTTLPVPSIIKQKEIVNEYNVLRDRISLNNWIVEKLEETAQTIYKQWFVDFEYPDENGKPYKSGGGEMEFNEVFDKEIPKGWYNTKMNELYEFQYGFGNVNPDNGGEYPVYGSNGIIGSYDKYNNEDAPVIGHIGANCGSLVFAQGKHFVTYNGVMCKIKKGFDKHFGYSVLLNQDLKSNVRGTSQPFISYDMLNEIDIIIPDKEFLNKFCRLLNPIFELINTKKNETVLLTSLSNTVLSKLSTLGESL